MEAKKTKYMDRAINEEILEKLSLKNRYAFLNANLMTVLEQDQMNFLKKAQKFCIRYEKKNEITHAPDEEFYHWIPDFGNEGLISRAHPYTEIDMNYEEHGLTIELMRCLALSFFDPQFSMAGGATILAINPVYFHSS